MEPRVAITKLISPPQILIPSVCSFVSCKYIGLTASAGFGFDGFRPLVSQFSDDTS